jgi:hypothetical protein
MTDQRRSLAALTMLDPSYPPYVSINQYLSGTVEITVRGPAVAHESKKFQVPGGQGTIQMTPAQFQTLCLEIMRNFRS